MTTGASSPASSPAREGLLFREDGKVSRRSYGAVIKAFYHEVYDAFLPIASELVLNGPERDNVVMQTAIYGRDGLHYCISLDESEMTVLTSVELESGQSQLVADLDGLIVVAEVGPANSVRHAARTVHDLRHTLQAQAVLIGKVHPLLLRAEESGTAESMFRRAGAKERNR